MNWVLNENNFLEFDNGEIIDIRNSDATSITLPPNKTERMQTGAKKS